jgi:hypothetical protein
MSRVNHLAWAKQRALWELEPGGGGVVTAISSIVQDLATHPDLTDHPALTRPASSSKESDEFASLLRDARREAEL